MALEERRTAVLKKFCERLIDQHAASVLVEPNERKSGFWFGGGNLVEDQSGGFYLTGRYRNYGDSRTGLHKGERGLELAVFRFDTNLEKREKILSFPKTALSNESGEVLSIEGSALYIADDHVELYVSSEKHGIPYPEDVKDYLKPGTGVWTIDVLKADSVEGLEEAKVEPFLQCRDPRYLQVKDPFYYVKENGDFVLLFVTHPFNWTSHNAGYIVKRKGKKVFDAPVWEFLPRGTTWDVAMTRATALAKIPRLGLFEQGPLVTLLFYDGGECLRQLDEHTKAVARSRGYSCEEIGGAAYFLDEHLNENTRLSPHFPMFVSPWGTGCSRYVDILTTEKGIYAIWQQSQRDFSQPLVQNYLPYEEVERILKGG